VGMTLNNRIDIGDRCIRQIWPKANKKSFNDIRLQLSRARV
jgi:hypothetical protein